MENSYAVTILILILKRHLKSKLKSWDLKDFFKCALNDGLLTTDEYINLERAIKK